MAKQSLRQLEAIRAERTRELAAAQENLRRLEQSGATPRQMRQARVSVEVSQQRMRQAERAIKQQTTEPKSSQRSQTASTRTATSGRSGIPSQAVQDYIGRYDRSIREAYDNRGNAGKRSMTIRNGRNFESTPQQMAAVRRADAAYDAYYSQEDALRDARRRAERFAFANAERRAMNPSAAGGRSSGGARKSMGGSGG